MNEKPSVADAADLYELVGQAVVAMEHIALEALALARHVTLLVASSAHPAQQEEEETR